MNGMQWFGWVVLLAALYQFLALLMDSLTSIMTGTWAWVLFVVLVLVGVWLAFFKK